MTASSLLHTAAILLSSLTCLACGGSEGFDVETVPASILDPDKNPAQPVEKRLEYRLTEKDQTPIFPAPQNTYHTDSGIKFVVFERGDQHEHPKSITNVTVHYEGYTSDGKQFDSSVKRGQPSSFVLTQVVPGWREGVKLMTVGDHFRFWIPEKEAYKGIEGKPKGLLIFDVKLISMKKS